MKKNMQKVSVIIPFYNRISWTVEAVNSVLRQSFEDYEVLLIDDGSSEDIDKLKSIEDPRVRLFRQDNKGQASATNLGLEKANGEYIAFLDSDDLWCKDKLRIQVGIMDANPKIAISHTSYTRVDIHKNPIETIESGLFHGWVFPEIYIHCPIATPTVMVRRDSIEKKRFCDVSISLDILFWASLCKDSEILGINQPLTKIRMHGENAATTIDKRIEGLKNVLKLGIIPEKTITNAKKRELESKILINIAGNYWANKNYCKSISNILRAMIIAPLNESLYISLFKKLKGLITKGKIDK